MPDDFGVTSGIVKRSVVIAGHATSVSLEAEFWGALKTIAEHRGIALSHLIAEIDSDHGGGNLSSALRLYVLRDLQGQLSLRGCDN